jgi:hypothetical protein
MSMSKEWGGYTFMSDPMILTDLQIKLMRYFYETPELRISLNKAERKNIWDDFVKNRDIENISHLEKNQNIIIFLFLIHITFIILFIIFLIQKLFYKYKI